MHPAKRVGIVLAFVGMVLFGVYHWFYVAPVAAVFVEGAVWAVAAGAALGWAYERTMLDHGRTGLAWGLGFGALLAATLVPYEVVGWIWGPFPTVDSPGDVLAVLPLAFVGVPFAAGIAWLLGRSLRRFEWSFVVLVLAIHFMIGGSVANFGGRGTTLVLFLGFVAMEILAGVVVAWWCGREQARPDERTEGAPARTD